MRKEAAAVTELILERALRWTVFCGEQRGKRFDEFHGFEADGDDLADEPVTYGSTPTITKGTPGTPRPSRIKL